jgi:hypothetical protein
MRAFSSGVSSGMAGLDGVTGGGLVRTGARVYDSTGAVSLLPPADDGRGTSRGGARPRDRGSTGAGTAP